MKYTIGFLINQGTRRISLILHCLMSGDMTKGKKHTLVQERMLHKNYSSNWKGTKRFTSLEINYCKRALCAIFRFIDHTFMTQGNK